MKTLNPYAEIEKAPLYAPDRMQSRGYSVRMDDGDGGWDEVGVVGPDYLLVPNRQVRDMALEIAGRSPVQWSEDKLYFDGKRYLYGLVARDGLRAEVEVGDAVALGMLFENSYDGSRRLMASLYVHRLACSNGMVIPQLFTSVRFKHDSSGAGWEDEVERALSMLHHAEGGLRRFAEAARRLSAIRLGSPELKALRQEALPRLPTTLWGKVVDRYLLHEELTAWGLLNAATNVCWHEERSLQAFGHNEYATSRMIELAAGQAAASTAFRLN